MMRTFYKPSVWARAVLSAVLFALFGTSDALAVQQVSGEVYARDVVDTYLELTGNTTLHVNKNLYLRRIYGNYELTITTNSNCQLMVDYDKSGQYAVDVKKLDIFGLGWVYFTGKDYCANVTYSMTVSGGTFTVSSRNKYDGAEPYALWCGGNITFNNCTVTCEGKTHGIFALGDIKMIGKNSKLTAYAGTSYLANEVLKANGAIRLYDGEINIKGKTCHCLNASEVYIGEPVMENGEYVEKTDKLKIYVNTSNQTANEQHWTKPCVYTTNLHIANCELTAECNADVFRVSGNAKVYPGATIDAWNRSDNPYSVFSVDGDFTAMKGSKIKVSGNRQGILCVGNITISSDMFNASANDFLHGTRAVYSSNGNIKLNINGTYTFTTSATVSPLYAAGSLIIDPPYLINNGEGYIVDGHEVNTKVYCYVNRPSLFSWAPNVSEGEATTVGGLNNTYVVGQTIQYNLPSSVTNNLYTYGVTMKYTWMRSQGLSPTNFEPVSEGATYTTTASDVGHYIKVQIEADKYTGALESNVATVIKAQNTAQPVAPAVYNGKTYLQVQNARQDQEYIVLPGDPRTDLTEADWANAVSPLANSTVVTVSGGTVNTYNTVYTRFKETTTTFAGTAVAHTTSYYGNTQSTGDYVIEVTGVGGTSVQFESDGSYDVPLNGRVRINLKSSNSSFNGVAGMYWGYHNNFLDAVTQYAGMYVDQSCTQPIYKDDNHFYKTVYLKFLKTGSYASGNCLSIMEGGLSPRDVNFNVAEADGTYPLEYILINGNNVLSVPAGTTMTVSTIIYPMAADLSGLTVSLFETQGFGTTNTPPVVTLSSDRQYVTIDAVGCKSDENVIYNFKIWQNGTDKGVARIKLIATAPQGIVLDKHNLTAEPGDTIQLHAQLIPAYAESEITWTSNYLGVARVDANGQVVMHGHDSQLTNFLGSTAKIIATAGGYSDTLVVKLNGRRFPLKVKGSYIHTYNADDVLGDGGSVTYEAGTLRLNNATLVTNTPYPSLALEQIESDVFDEPVSLTIELKGTNTLSSRTGDGMKLVRSARFSGNGTLQVQGSYNGINCNSSIVVEDSARVTVIGPTSSTSYGQCGITATSIDVSGSNAQLRANGFRSVCVTDNVLHGEITQPVGAMLVDTFVAYVDGVPVSNEWVVINGESSDYLRGDVNNDGKVDVSDVNILVNILLGKDTADNYDGRAYVTEGDTNVDVTDVNMVINIMLGKI